MPAAELPGAPGPADSIIQRLIDAARRPAGVRFVGQSVAPVAGDGFVPWAEIHEEAKGVAVALRSLSTHLSAAQLGITVTNLIIGFMAEPAIAGLLDGPLESIGISGATSTPQWLMEKVKVAIETVMAEIAV